MNGTGMYFIPGVGARSGVKDAPNPCPPRLPAALQTANTASAVTAGHAGHC